MVSRGSSARNAATSATVPTFGVATCSRTEAGNAGASGTPRASSTFAAYPHAAHIATSSSPAAVEDPAVGAFVVGVRLVQCTEVGVERVRVLHQDLAGPQHPRARPRLVALLRLDLVPHLGQVAVGADLTRGEPGDDLLVGHPEAQVAPVSVLELEHLGDALPPPRLLPDLGGVDDGHRDLLTADRVHLLADDRDHLVEHALAEREVDVDPRRQLAHEAGTEHETVAERLGVGRIFPERRDERLRAAHGYFASFFLFAPLTPGS